MNPARDLAFRALQRWRRSRQFADRIAQELFSTADPSAADKAFALELFYGVLRNLTLLDFWIGRLRSGPVEPGARDLLRLGLYQIMPLETAPHAAVFETVELAPARTRKLINAILRRASREKPDLMKMAEVQPPAVRFSEPEFLIEKWTGQFGEEVMLELCRWNNQPPPVYARINQLKLSPTEFLQRYPNNEPLLEPSGFVRSTAPGVAIANGDCYVQDPSTALAPELLAPFPNQTVLDACAAPGGKTAHLAQLMGNTGRLVAIDQDEGRLERLRENLSRLGVKNARILRCDWRDKDSISATGLERESFDKILLDAPCSNTGVMRRRVDVRWRLRPDDFVRMPQQQLAILRAVAPFLKPGGSLVYSTCSLETEENEAVVAAFLRGAEEFGLMAEEKRLPFRDATDGAFAARLTRHPRNGGPVG